MAEKKPVKLLKPINQVPLDSVSNRTRQFFFNHPLEGLAIGTNRGYPIIDSSTNISTNTTRFSTQIGLQENQERKGSQRNAFRHALWQATITRKYDENIAKEAGDAHEIDPAVDISQHVFKKNDAPEPTLDRADQTADLLNNQIGRKLGKANPNLSTKQLALHVLNYFYKVGLFTVEQTDSVTLTVKQTKLTADEYNKGLKKLELLDENGYPVGRKPQHMSDTLEKTPPAAWKINVIPTQ